MERQGMRPATMTYIWLAAAVLVAAAGCSRVDEARLAAGSDGATGSSTSSVAAPGGTPAAGPGASKDEQAALAKPTSPADAEAPAKGVALRGVVKLEGKPPERLPIDMTRVPECVAAHGKEQILNEDAIVGSAGEIKNAFVYVRRPPKGKQYPLPAQPAELDQSKCMYRPRVQGMRVGQTLKIVNSDDFAHNVRGYPLLNPIFNIGQMGKDVREKVFEKTEAAPIKFKCDIHPWMTAYVFVLDHPYFAVTGDDGTFEIAGLPPGDYTLAVWHETFGKQQREIKVGDQALSGLDFTLKTGTK
jgi:hypothetical protein